jgi:hypothetical protein
MRDGGGKRDGGERGYPPDAGRLPSGPMSGGLRELRVNAQWRAWCGGPTAAVFPRSGGMSSLLGH